MTLVGLIEPSMRSTYATHKWHWCADRPTHNPPAPALHPLLCIQALYKSKAVTDQAAGQWRKPCPHELQAALHTMIHTPPRGAAAVNNTGSSDTSSAPQPAPLATAAAVDSAADAAGGAGSSGCSPSTAAAAARGASPASDGGDSPARQSSSSSSDGGSSLSSSNSIDSCDMNNEGVVEGKTRLSLIFLLDSSGSVGDGECPAVAYSVSVEVRICGLLSGRNSRSKMIGALHARVRACSRLHGHTWLSCSPPCRCSMSTVVPDSQANVLSHAMPCCAQHTECHESKLVPTMLYGAKPCRVMLCCAVLQRTSHA